MKKILIIPLLVFFTVPFPRFDLRAEEMIPIPAGPFFIGESGDPSRIPALVNPDQRFIFLGFRCVR